MFGQAGAAALDLGEPGAGGRAGPEAEGLGQPEAEVGDQGEDEGGDLGVGHGSGLQGRVWVGRGRAGELGDDVAAPLVGDGVGEA